MIPGQSCHEILQDYKHKDIYMLINSRQSCPEISQDWKHKDLCEQTRDKVAPRSSKTNMNLSMELAPLSISKY